MNRTEKEEINLLPPKYRPLGAWSYFGYNILFALPLIGWIFMVVFALSDTNINRRSFARSFFCVWAIVIVIVVLVAIVAATVGLGALAGGGN